MTSKSMYTKRKNNTTLDEDLITSTKKYLKNNAKKNYKSRPYYSATVL